MDFSLDRKCQTLFQMFPGLKMLMSWTDAGYVPLSIHWPDGAFSRFLGLQLWSSSSSSCNIQVLWTSVWCRSAPPACQLPAGTTAPASPALQAPTAAPVRSGSRWETVSLLAPYWDKTFWSYMLNVNELRLLTFHWWILISFTFWSKQNPNYWQKTVFTSTRIR